MLRVMCALDIWSVVAEGWSASSVLSALHTIQGKLPRVSQLPDIEQQHML